ncbi:DUF4286 family protein [Pseudorhodoferax sp. Leaf267]|uniref:DUF4286 family protein n=1 Tax=Pseudorhodoferax sp. Leaf267 TaxID=1736316 RepID=UPI0006F9ED60|nr:DUF4286 family protein [Pseudorhodoferax sp. Leaf267]KQP12210.1 hypothetical protein ASF43_22105 [Pseudorhodoferax sp. Leaf267]
MPEATALLALWNGVTPELDAEYNAWHAEEHVPERLTVPGMLWARRYGAHWPQTGPRYLTLYGLRDAWVLEEDAYQRLLREPTPMSARMRPHLCHLSRWVCALREAEGAPVGEGLRVQTFEERPVALPDALLAERLHDAAPLPWLQGGQEHAVRGHWLLAIAQSERPTAPEPGAMLYAALPIGPR